MMDQFCPSSANNNLLDHNIPESSAKKKWVLSKDIVLWLSDEQPCPATKKEQHSVSLIQEEER
jgi:hypothetical protein